MLRQAQQPNVETKLNEQIKQINNNNPLKPNLNIMNNQHIILVAYFIYLPIAILLTILVAKNLFKNGKVFMLDIFNGREELAFATNKLFEVGFYLLNIGFALLILKYSEALYNYQIMVEALSYKIGGFSIYLGIMLFLNLYLFFRGKRKSKESRLQHAQNLNA